MNLDIILNNAIARYADHISIDDGARQFTFRQTGQRITRLGNALLALGVRRQDRLASLQFNSVETIEFDLMAARFGLVRTLLNARSSMDDWIYALNHCQAKTLIFGPEFADSVKEAKARLPQVEHFVCTGKGPAWALAYEDLIGRGGMGPPEYEVTDSDWHSVYYTSGTTGRPKGVVLNQRNWLVLIRNHLADLFKGASTSDVVLHAAPLSHGSGALVLSHFARGARQLTMPRFEPGEVLERFQRDRVTTLFLAPTMILMLLQHPDHDRTEKSSLHSVVYGGAPMATEHLRDTLRRWGPVMLQGYGQWEAPQFFTCLDQRQHADALAGSHPRRLASCGRPLTFAKVAVMDTEGRLLPPGQDGEVVTAGDHLMVGYLDDPKATAAERHGIWQRTGDIGRMDEDGFLYLTDRKKDMIITGGSNVYPREVEEVLHAHPSVFEAVVVGVPDEKWGERVHALIVPRGNHKIDAGTFLAWCRERLAGDKRPRSVEVLAELPKSAYGKILRREIRDRFWQNAARRI